MSPSPREKDSVRLYRAVRTPRGGPWISPAELTELVWAVAETHPGLAFLKDPESAEFQRAYVEAVSPTA